MGVWLGPMGGKVKGGGDVDYTGNGEFYSDGNGNWEIMLKSSGTLTFKKSPGIVDVFLVGAGNDGSAGSIKYDQTHSRAIGGTGGEAGGTATKTVSGLRRNVGYAAKVGVTSGGDMDTEIFDESVYGYITPGAEGAWSGEIGVDPGSGNAGAVTGGSKAFGESGTHFGGDTMFGVPGGGGAAAVSTNGSAIAASGNGGTITTGTWTASGGGNAAANTGNGGGGGAGLMKSGRSDASSSYGTGADGCIIIRNHRGD